MSTEKRPPPGTPDDYFLNSEGLWIYTRRWLPTHPPKAAVFVLHGMSEHCGRYAAFAEHLVKQGYAVFSMDHQGHGRSEGERVHVAGFERYAADALAMVRRALAGGGAFGAPLPAGLPLFLVGHSMGGLIAIETASASVAEGGPGWSGVVLVGPALMPDPATANPLNLFLAPRLSKVVPKLAIFWEKGPAARFPMTHDPAVEAAYKADPLVYKGGLRVLWGWSILEAMLGAMAAAPEFTSPYLLLHGTEDKACLLEGSEKWHSRTKSADKELCPIQGAYHEVLTEAEPYRAEAFRRIDAFVAARLSARGK